MILYQCEPNDEVEILGNKYTVTNKARGYKVGVIDSKGNMHYLNPQTKIEKRKIKK